LIHPSVPAITVPLPPNALPRRTVISGMALLPERVAVPKGDVYIGGCLSRRDFARHLAANSPTRSPICPLSCLIFHSPMMRSSLIYPLRPSNTGKSLEDVVKESHGVNVPLFNNAAQHYNHWEYWKSIKPNGGGKIPGKLEKALIETFGSIETVKQEFASRHDAIRFWLGVARLEGREDLRRKDRERRKSFNSGGNADFDHRCLGAYLLYRLLECRLSQSLFR
jgi:hypothetical protein